MTKALNTVKKLCHNVDMMVEVRDARVGEQIAITRRFPSLP